jgi:hypothetical protein
VARWATASGIDVWFSPVWSSSDARLWGAVRPRTSNFWSQREQCKASAPHSGLWVLALAITWVTVS